MREHEPQDLLHHLNDLRWCLIRSIVAWGATTVIGVAYARPIIHYLTRSVGELVVLGVTEALIVQVKVGMGAGAAMAAPMILWQVWHFIAPGLSIKERHELRPLIPMVVIMPLIGGAFALWIVLPQVVHLLQTLGGADWRLFLSLGQFVSFTLALIWPLALAFEVPVLIYLTARLGWLSSTTLWRRWRLMVLLAFIVAAVLSPGPDVAVQLVLVVPLLLLYGLSIFVARMAEAQYGQRARAQQARE